MSDAHLEPVPGETLLLRLWSDGEAAMVRQLLDSYGIPCRVVSDVPHSLFPLTVDGLGEIRILVAEECIEEARALIAEHKRRGLEVVEGGKEASDGAAAERDPADPSAGDVSGRRGGS